MPKTAVAVRKPAKSGVVLSKWEHHSGIFGGGNCTLDGKGFFISYNPSPGGGISLFISDGGGAETALCIKKRDGGTTYLILNGDFRKDYEKLVPKGITACKKFYESKKKKHDSSWTSGDA